MMFQPIVQLGVILPVEFTLIRKAAMCYAKEGRTYHSERTRRSSTETKFYRGMCDDIPKRKKQRTMVIKPDPSGPSNSRLEAQDRIEQRNYNLRNGLKDDVNRRLTRSYRMFQPNVKTDNSDLDITPSEYDTDDDDVPKTVSKQSEPEKVVKCDVKTHTVGIKKHHKMTVPRKHKCKEHDCGFITDCAAKLNNRHKEQHQLVICDVCKEYFNTPSTLARHVYKHRDLKFKCDQCGKRFPFEKDRDLHLNTHRTIKSFRCANSNCDRSYFSKGELDKHAKTHDNITWKCKLCIYTNADERNLKAHMRVHSSLKKYLCPTCLRLFKYDTQLRHHLPCKGNASSDREKDSSNKQCSNPEGKPKRSESPEF